MTPAPPTPPAPGPRPHPQQGSALVMVLIFVFLLYILVADLVTTSRMIRISGENEMLMARMRNHMAYIHRQVEDTLLEDLQAAAEGEGGEGPGALPSSGPGAAPPVAGSEGGIPGMEGEGGEAEGAAASDGSQDAWFAPQAHSEGDLTSYSWVEDENRKFNLLTLLSEDDEFARESRERLVRLVDYLREDTDFDLNAADGETLATEFIDWVETRTRTMEIPRPPLKTDDQERPQLSLPLHLDELKMLPSVDEEIFYDKVLDGRVIPGLESVLTIWTSLAPDPGDPVKNAQRAARGEGPEGQGEGPGPQGGGESAGGGEAQGTEGGATQPIGEGVRININTAPPAVLRAMFPRGEVSDIVIDAILRHRNEEVEEEEGLQQAVDDYYGDVRMGEEVKRKVFTDIAQLEEIPEFANIADPRVKDEFMQLFTVHSDVFTVHLASMYKRNEKTRSFVMRRTASVLVRIDDGEDGYLHPLVLLEDRHGLRVQQSDFPEEEARERSEEYLDMDVFAQEERAWNPFLIDFYLPQDERDQFYMPELYR